MGLARRITQCHCQHSMQAWRGVIACKICVGLHRPQLAAFAACQIVQVSLERRDGRSSS